MIVGAKFARKSSEFVAALVTCRTIAEAAKSAGISEATAYRWMREPGFGDALAAARRAAFADTLHSMQGVAMEAVTNLRRLMTCGLPSVECRASIALLDGALRARETEDVDERLRLLEDVASRIQSGGLEI